MKTAIVTDSSAGISLEREQELGITVLRMPLVIDEEEHIEGSTISRESLIEAMLDGKTVRTSQPNIQNTMDTFTKLLENYDHIIYLPISKHLSGTFDTANMISQDFEGKLTVIDTECVSWPLQRMTIDVIELLEKGYTAEEIKSIIEEQSYMFAVLIPDDLQYLKRGGRIKPAAAAVANLLKIIPILSVTEGEIDLYDKVRTHKKAIATGFEKVLEFKPVEEYHWAVLNGGAEDSLVESIVENLHEKTGEPVYSGHVYPIVLAHTGPGTVAFAAVKKIKELT